MLVISEALININFVGHGQLVRHQTRVKMNNTCNLINTYNSINCNENNKPVENRDRVKSYQLNKHLKKGTTTKSY